MLDFLVVLDFEATCDEVNAPIPQEVIEFPSVLLSLATLEPVDEFSSFVRPSHHPRLSQFCGELTGIRQEDVDAAPLFPEVLSQHTEWLSPRVANGSWAFALCGDWDLGTMFPAQCQAAGIHVIPPGYRQWVNVKHMFARFTGARKGPGMAAMLAHLGLELRGRHHRGIDDCRNIARIVQALVRGGVTPEITTHLALSRYPPLALTVRLGEERREVTLDKRSLGTLCGRASGLFRRQVTTVRWPDGSEVSDADLLDLEPGSELVVSQ